MFSSKEVIFNFAAVIPIHVVHRRKKMVGLLVYIMIRKYFRQDLIFHHGGRGVKTRVPTEKNPVIKVISLGIKPISRPESAHRDKI